MGEILSIAISMCVSCHLTIIEIYGTAFVDINIRKRRPQEKDHFYKKMSRRNDGLHLIPATNCWSEPLAQRITAREEGLS